MLFHGAVDDLSLLPVLPCFQQGRLQFTGAQVLVLLYVHDDIRFLAAHGNGRFGRVGQALGDTGHPSALDVIGSDDGHDEPPFNGILLSALVRTIKSAFQSA